MRSSDDNPGRPAREPDNIADARSRQRARRRRANFGQRHLGLLEFNDGPRLEYWPTDKLLISMGKMARPERFELPTFWFVARRSIQLSYGRVMLACLPRGRSFQ